MLADEQLTMTKFVQKDEILLIFSKCQEPFWSFSPLQYFKIILFLLVSTTSLFYFCRDVFTHTLD